MNVQKLAALALTSLLALPAMAQTTTTPGTTRSTPPAATTHTTTTTTPSTAPRTATTAPSTSSSTTGTKPTSAQDKLVDINSASASELDALPGIGKARAAAIIKNRPYKGKDDLASKHVIPQNVYDGIKDKIIARQG
jgi:competence protein ComEA